MRVGPKTGVTIYIPKPIRFKMTQNHTEKRNNKIFRVGVRAKRNSDAIVVVWGDYKLYWWNDF